MPKKIPHRIPRNQPKPPPRTLHQIIEKYPLKLIALPNGLPIALPNSSKNSPAHRLKLAKNTYKIAKNSPKKIVNYIGFYIIVIYKQLIYNILSYI